MSKTTRRLIAPEDLLRIIRVSDPSLAPDGSRVLFTTRTCGERNDQPSQLWLADTSGDRVRRLTAGPRDGSGRFSHDGSAVYFVRSRVKGETQIAIVPLDGGEAEELTELAPGSIGSLKVGPNGTHLAFTWRMTEPERTTAAASDREQSGASEPPMVIDDPWYRLDGDGYFGGARYGLWLMEIATRKLTCLDRKDNSGGLDFDFSPDGKSIVYTTNRAKRACIQPWREEMRLVDVRNGRTQKIDWLPEGPKSSPVFSPDGRQIAFAGREGREGAYSTDNLELQVADLGKKTVRSLSDHEDECMMSVSIADSADASFASTLAWSSDGKRIWTRIGRNGEGRIVSYAVGRPKLTVHLEGAAEHGLGSFDRAGGKVCLLKSTATKLTEVFVAEVKGTAPLEPRRLTGFNDALLKELKLSKPSSHWVKAADGTKVHTWVMRPPNAKPGKVTPGILEIHGGPHGLYGCGFFHEFQVLAAQGWTVVYSNPRGSKGYGRDHCDAIKGSWGQADWEDIQAVTRFMQDHKGIDRKRIGIMGGSYGGYMTNWAVSHSKDYVAAITDRCVSNLVSMFGSSDFIWPPDAYWPGAVYGDSSDLWEASPVKHFKGVRTPMLIIHSEGDLRCNIEQSEQIHASLVVQNVPCRFVRYPRSSSHGMSRSGPPDLRLHRLGEIIDWWTTYLR
jgi:dipeptidyl aminopeptidase/acylaminoacyl peptidase